MVDINARLKKTQTKLQGDKSGERALYYKLPLIEVTPVLRLVALPVCLKLWSERSDPCNN
jgi:hypothetical protein